MSSEPAEVVAYLRGRDAACPICDYNLRDIDEPVCPECGHRLKLVISSPSLRTGPWTLAIIAPSLALGFDGVTLLITVIVAIVSGGASLTPGALFFILGLVTLTLISTIALAWLILDRRRFRRMQVRDQWRLAASLFVGVFVLHALGGLLIAAAGGL